MSKPLNRYLKPDEINKKPLGESASKRVFKAVVSDYLDQKIDDEELEIVATSIYYEANKPFDIVSIWDNKFSSLLSTTTDIVHMHENKATEFNKLVENLRVFVK